MNILMNIDDIVTNINFSQRNMIGIGIFISILVIATFLFAAWQWRSDWLLAHQGISSEPVIGSLDEKAGIVAIPDAHLFGKVLSKANEIPITTMQLRVTGIVKVTSERYGTFSKAYISISGQPS